MRKIMFIAAIIIVGCTKKNTDSTKVNNTNPNNYTSDYGLVWLPDGTNISLSNFKLIINQDSLVFVSPVGVAYKVAYTAVKNDSILIPETAQADSVWEYDNFWSVTGGNILRLSFYGDSLSMYCRRDSALFQIKFFRN